MEQGFGGEPEEEEGGEGADEVDGDAGDVIAQDNFPVDRVGPHEGGGGVHDAAVEDGGGDDTEDAEAQARAAEDALAVQDAGQPADDAHGEHLPRCPRALREQHIRDQHGHRADQESGLAAEGHARQNRHGDDGLELRQHEERGAPRHIQRNEHGDEHQFPRLRLAPLENQEERQHTFQQNEQRNKVIFPSLEIVIANEQRERNEQEDQERRKDRPLLQLALFYRRLDEVIRTFGLSANR